MMVSVAEVVIAAALAGKVVVVVAVVATAVAVAVAVAAAVVEVAVVVSVTAVIVLVGLVVKLNQSVDFGGERMSGDMQGRRFCKMWAFLRSKEGDVLWNFKAHYLRLFI